MSRAMGTSDVCVCLCLSDCVCGVCMHACVHVCVCLCLSDCVCVCVVCVCVVCVCVCVMLSANHVLSIGVDASLC